MIKKVSKEWGGIEEATRQVAGGDTGSLVGESGELKEVVSAIAGVRDVLKKMCQVSVTRTTLKSAVREALLPVIREYKDELFPELVDLRQRLEAAPAEAGIAGLTEPPQAISEEVKTRLEDFEERIKRLGELDDEVQSSFAEVGGRVSEVDDRVDKQVERLDQVAQDLGEFGGRLEDVDTKLKGDVERLDGRIGEVSDRVSEVEESLRKEMAEMVKALVDKLSELREILARVEEVMPQRQLVEAVEKRLGRLEEQFSQVSSQVQNIDSVTPEMQGLRDRFTELRKDLDSISGEVGEAGHSLNQLRDSLSERLVELQRLLESGIDRWEEDQSHTLERLSSIRDTLRDQLKDVTTQVEAAQKSFIGKMIGKDPGLKMNREEWELLSGKIEGIVSGLESILAKKKG